MNEYQKVLSNLKGQSKLLATKDRQTSILRLLCLSSAIILFYQYYVHQQAIWLVSGSLSTFVFGLVINYHSTMRWKARFIQEKIRINENEINFLKGDLSAFENGKEFMQNDHSYSYDLDFFGDQSLYQSLNRTTTVVGKKILADSLLRILSNEEIHETQEAVKELTSLLEWRQTFGALARMNPDSEGSYKELMKWAQQKPITISQFIRIISFLLPTVTLLSFCYYLITSSGLAGNISGLLFLINLGILGSFSKSIKNELLDTTRIEKILKQYAFLLKEIEHQKFNAEKLDRLKRKLDHSGHKASYSIRQLALLFGRMEHVANVFASPLLNGAFLFHIHVLYHLSRWRQQHASEIKEWLDIIGEIETLSSLSNFSYNNPEYIFPDLNRELKIQFEDLGHPLLPKSSAVTNSIDFSNHQFFTLTGSNMSGKSTFLRTIGVNMVLAGIGAPVFASRATIQPLPVHVSMRLSDSLTDSESYFYAEVKRLKTIMDELEEGPCFVLLDEILRGTNSDDKRNGTIEVIRKIATKKAIGGIATHDLEVCKTSEEYPEVLTNKRFEVEIVDDELVFDYKLRDGICQNKSASFIMKKMGVI